MNLIAPYPTTVGAICNRESGNQFKQFAITNRSYTDTTIGGFH